MLARNTYPQTYIDACRARIDSQLAEFRKLVAARKRVDAKGAMTKAFEAFESAYFNNMVIVLEASFVHRTRALEKNDGNPLNEVRALAGSMMTNDETMTADSTIKMNAAKSVLGYEVGDAIRLNEDDFVRLSEAFFADIERKYAGA